MNAWTLAAAICGLGLAPCADLCLRGSPERRLVGLDLAGMIVTLVLVLQSVGSGRTVFFDLPLALALVNFGGGLVFARFLEKHL